MPEKYKFHKEEIKYLELMIVRGGVKMDLDKVAAVQDYPVPQSTFDVH